MHLRKWSWLGPAIVASREQAGGPDGVAPEPAGDAVGGTVGLGPAVLALAEEQLPVDAFAGHESLEPHAHQPDPGSLQPEGVVGTEGLAEDLLGHVGRLTEGAR